MKKHFPKDLFLMGVFMTLVRTAFLPVLALVLLLLQLVVPAFDLSIFSVMLLLVWVLYALCYQIWVAHFMFHSENELFKMVVDPDHAEDWKELLREDTRKKMDAQMEREKGQEPSEPEEREEE